MASLWPEKWRRQKVTLNLENDNTDVKVESGFLGLIPTSLSCVNDSNIPLV